MAKRNSLGGSEPPPTLGVSSIELGGTGWVESISFSPFD
jgi:hypothetical protein